MIYFTNTWFVVWSTLYSVDHSEANQIVTHYLFVALEMYVLISCKH